MDHEEVGFTRKYSLLFSHLPKLLQSTLGNYCKTRDLYHKDALLGSSEAGALQGGPRPSISKHHLTRLLQWAHTLRRSSALLNTLL